MTQLKTFSSRKCSRPCTAEESNCLCQDKNSAGLDADFVHPDQRPSPESRDAVETKPALCHLCSCVAACRQLPQRGGTRAFLVAQKGVGLVPSPSLSSGFS